MAEDKTTKKGTEYIVSASYAKKDLLTIRDHQHVNVTGKAYTKKLSATKDSPEREYTYREGTQDDRKWYYEQAIVKGKDGKPILDANGKEQSKQRAILKISNE